MSEKVEIIQVPNTLRAKVGGKFGTLDRDAIAAAEAALYELSDQFGEWLAEEVQKLEEVYAEIKTGGATEENMKQLYNRCHDLKGQGSTYGFPLITRIAGSVCKLLDEPDGRSNAPRVLVGAHLDAIRAIVRGQIKSESHPVGVALASELEQRVLDYIKGH